MITAKGDRSLDDFLEWAVQAGHGHYVVKTCFKNYMQYCQYMKEVKGELSEKQRYVEE